MSTATPSAPRRHANRWQDPTSCRDDPSSGPWQQPLDVLTNSNGRPRRGRGTPTPPRSRRRAHPGLP